MPTPQALESLRVLAGAGNRGGFHDPTGSLELAGLRRARERELKDRLGANPGDERASGLLGDLQDELSSDPFTGDAARAATGRVQAVNAGVQEYNRPDVMAIREQQEKGALEKLLAPVRMKGQFDVEAAKQHAQAASANTQALIGGRQQVAETNQGAIAARAAAAQKAAALRQQYQLVATDKVQPNVGFFERLTGGAGAAKQKMLADLQAQIDAALAEENAPDDALTPAGAVSTTESPAARMARLRAAMGR